MTPCPHDAWSPKCKKRLMAAKNEEKIDSMEGLQA